MPLRELVQAAFFDVHDGRSTDDVVIDDELNRLFISRCKSARPSANEFDLNWTLLNLRKGSALGPVVTVKLRQCHDDYIHAAEFAARHLEDKCGLTIDRVLCAPSLRGEFDRLAARLAPDTENYLLRKAALKLRKGRQLRPELTKRVADWGREVMRFETATLQADTSAIPRAPGVYLFSDPTGYLYIGEAENLRTRVAKHLDHSDRKALARYLWEEGFENLILEFHVFDPESNGRLKAHRRAYEADLIRNRGPRFNIQV